MTAVARPARPGLLAELWYIEKRIAGLSRFALAITVLNILGHLWLGFEQPWATPFVALAAAYLTELAGETADALGHRRRPKYMAGPASAVIFLLPSHISGLAVGMLLYPAENLWAIAFASSLAVASKYVLRIEMPGTGRDGAPVRRHFLNPSNFGITVTLLLFPMVGIAPPYHFLEQTTGALDWLLPLIVIGTGSLLNVKLTGKLPLILTWVAAFAAQAVLRSLLNGTPLIAALFPMTGFAFVLFTFYMITDPATSPARRQGQVAFAIAVALLYMLFMELNVVFGLFYALTCVTAARGLLLYLIARRGAEPAQVWPQVPIQKPGRS